MPSANREFITSLKQIPGTVQEEITLLHQELTGSNPELAIETMHSGFRGFVHKEGQSPARGYHCHIHRARQGGSELRSTVEQKAELRI